MEHAITIGDVAMVALVIGGISAFAVLLYFLVWFFNPWRSGH
jgi:phage shock protein PspC (stress-responsive transcriptional regulator)